MKWVGGVSPWNSMNNSVNAAAVIIKNLSQWHSEYAC